MTRTPYYVRDGYVPVMGLTHPYNYAAYDDVAVGNGGMTAVDYGEENAWIQCSSTQKEYEDVESRGT